jgi:hypothetical protein
MTRATCAFTPASKAGPMSWDDALDVRLHARGEGGTDVVG